MAELATIGHVVKAVVNRERKYLTFPLAEEESGIGIIVDSVSEALNIRAGEIEDTPNFGSHLDTGYILGMAKTGKRVKILLDIDRVLSSEENGNRSIVA